jgi:glycosyltransferase involved in cell wall biosynthesis
MFNLFKKPKYKFSIVTAVYNTEEYLSDAINSVINQSIGFEDNVQLILVNDGSTDRSGEICKTYKKLYPKNIVYIKQRNKGVSSARNRGLKKVKGKYVNFLDSDDKLSKNTLEEVWEFFEKHYDEIDFVSIPIHFFDAKKGEHRLNYKFKENKVINLLEEPQSPQLSIASSFLKSEICKSKKFDAKVLYTEDMKYLSHILMDNPKYGVITKPKYFYRRRKDKSSAIQESKQDLSWYFDTPKLVYLNILKKAEEKFSKIPDYFMDVVMYDMQYRLMQRNIADTIGKENFEKYKDLIKAILKKIDDSIIMNQRRYYKEHIILAYALKYNKSIEEICDELVVKSGKFYFKNILFDKDLINIKFEKVTNIKHKYEIEGHISSIIPFENIDIKITDEQNKPINVSFEKEQDKDKSVFGLTILRHSKFRFKGESRKNNIPLKFKIEYKNHLLSTKLLSHKDKKIRDRITKQNEIVYIN